MVSSKTKISFLFKKSCIFHTCSCYVPECLPHPQESSQPRALLMLRRTPWNAEIFGILGMLEVGLPYERGRRPIRGVLWAFRRNRACTIRATSMTRAAWALLPTSKASARTRSSRQPTLTRLRCCPWSCLGNRCKRRRLAEESPGSAEQDAG